MENIFEVLGKSLGFRNTTKGSSTAIAALLVALSMASCNSDPVSKDNSDRIFAKDYTNLKPEPMVFDYDPQLHSNLNNYLEDFRKKLLERAKDTSFLQSNNIVLKNDGNTTEVSFEYDSTQYAITVPHETLSENNHIELVACFDNKSRLFTIYKDKVIEEQRVLKDNTSVIVNKIPFNPKHLSDIEHIVGHSAEKMNLEGVDTISWEVSTDPEYLEKLKPINDFWELLQTTLVYGEDGIRSKISSNELMFEVKGNDFIYTLVGISNISVSFSKNKKNAIVIDLDDGFSHEKYSISMDGTRLTGMVGMEDMKYDQRYKKLLEAIKDLKFGIPQKYIDEFNDSKAKKIEKD